MSYEYRKDVIVINLFLETASNSAFFVPPQTLSCFMNPSTKLMHALEEIMVFVAGETLCIEY